MSRFDILTKYIAIITPEAAGEQDDNLIETNVRSDQMATFRYSDEIRNFIHDAYILEENNKDLELGNYRDILSEHGIEWSLDAMKNVDVSNMNMQCVLALIIGAIRADRFYEGTFIELFEGGYILKWLNRLNAIDQGVR